MPFRTQVRAGFDLPVALGYTRPRLGAHGACELATFFVTSDK